MSKLRGLPKEKKMRHDSHFVEEITSRPQPSIGRMISIEEIKPNPNQPRKQFGDLTELVQSIKEKGILEPILVRNYEGHFQIIAGERRFQASKVAGLQHLPCIEIDVDNRGVLEISLIENLQRKDLTPFEEAAAIHGLSEQFRYTHEEIAKKLSKSRTVITEALSLNRMPEEIQERCRQADINSKSMLLQIVRQPNLQEMHAMIDRITGTGMTREEARQFNRDGEKRPKSRTKNFTFRFKPDKGDFNFRMTFDKSEIEATEVIQALEEVLVSLREQVTDEEESSARTLKSNGNARGDRPIA